jgi:hypothetical protein
VAVGDGIGRASVNAVAAEDAAGVVNIIDTGVALSRGDAIGFVVFGGFDVNTIRGARSCAKKTTNAFLEAVFVALEYVNAAIARRYAGGDFRVTLGGGFAKHRAQSDAEALAEGRKCLADFADYGSHRGYTLARVRQTVQTYPLAVDLSQSSLRELEFLIRTSSQQSVQEKINQ